MAHYILDTDICSYIMKRSHPVLLKRIRSVPISDQAVSVVTMAELLYGAKLSVDDGLDDHRAGERAPVLRVARDERL